MGWQRDRGIPYPASLKQAVGVTLCQSESLRQLIDLESGGRLADGEAPAAPVDLPERIDAVDGDADLNVTAGEVAVPPPESATAPVSMPPVTDGCAFFLAEDSPVHPHSTEGIPRRPGIVPVAARAVEALCAPVCAAVGHDVQAVSVIAGHALAVVCASLPPSRRPPSDDAHGSGTFPASAGSFTPGAADRVLDATVVPTRTLVSDGLSDALQQALMAEDAVSSVHPDTVRQVRWLFRSHVEGMLLLRKTLNMLMSGARATILAGAGVTAAARASGAGEANQAAPAAHGAPESGAAAAPPLGQQQPLPQQPGQLRRRKTRGAAAAPRPSSVGAPGVEAELVRAHAVLDAANADLDRANANLDQATAALARSIIAAPSPHLPEGGIDPLSLQVQYVQSLAGSPVAASHCPLLFCSPRMRSNTALCRSCECGIPRKQLQAAATRGLLQKGLEHGCVAPWLFVPRCLPRSYPTTLLQVKEADGTASPVLPPVALWSVECAVCGCTPDERGAYARDDWLWVGEVRVCSARCKYEATLRPPALSTAEQCAVVRLVPAREPLPPARATSTLLGRVPLIGVVSKLAIGLRRAVSTAWHAAGFVFVKTLLSLCEQVAWQCSLVLVRLPLFVVLSWAVAALATALAIFASLYIGRAALQATHITALCTHDFYALVTGFFITFFLSDTLMVAVYGLVNVAAGLVRRYASRCATLAITVSDTWRQQGEAGSEVPQLAYAHLPVALVAAARSPALARAHLTLFDAATGYNADAAGMSARVRHALLRASLWVALPLHSFAVRSGIDVGNMSAVPAFMTRRRARGAVAVAAALLLVLPLTIGATVSCFTSPAGMASYMAGRAHWRVGEAIHAAATSPGATAQARSAWGGLVDASAHVATSAQVRGGVQMWWGMPRLE